MAVEGQIFVTARHGVETTVTVQVAELAVAELPHTSVPDTLKVSLLGPQVVGVMVCGGKATLAPAARELMLVIVTVVLIPLASMISSVTTMFVMVAVPQLVTKPDTV